MFCAKKVTKLPDLTVYKGKMDTKVLDINQATIKIQQIKHTQKDHRTSMYDTIMYGYSTLSLKNEHDTKKNNASETSEIINRMYPTSD
jgi:hypothetical protein